MNNTYNACIDYFKFVFPFYQATPFGNNLKKYEEEMKMYLLDHPGTTYEDAIDYIEEVHGIDLRDKKKNKIFINRDEKDYEIEDPFTGVWTLTRIRTYIEKIFNLKILINDGVQENLTGAYGFKYMYEYTKGVAFLYEGTEMKFVDPEGKLNLNKTYKTCCIELKGHGCRVVEGLGVDLVKVIEKLYKIPGCHSSRTDYAIDVINNDFINFPWLEEKIYSKMFITNFKKVQFIKSFDIESESLVPNGETITFGSDGSTSKLNIYDKKAERINRTGCDVTVDSWIRFELQCFKEKSENVIGNLRKYLMTDTFQRFTSSLLLNHLNILRKPDKGEILPNYRSTRVRTYPSDRNWLKFLGNVEHIKLENQFKVESSFVATKNWYNKAVIKTQVSLDLLKKEYPTSDIDILEQKLKALDELDNSSLNQLNDYVAKEYDASRRFTLSDIQALKEDIQKQLKMLKYFEEHKELLNDIK